MRTWEALLLGAIIGIGAAVGQGAVLVHRYSFDDGTANDSVGTADGTLINGATVVSHQLVTAGGGSGSAGTNPCVNLTSANPVSGLSGDFSIEQWFTRSDTVSSFQTLFGFGSDTSNYIEAVVARGGSDPMTSDLSVSLAINGSTAIDLGPSNLVGGTEHQLVTTYVAATKAFSIYLDGTFLASNTTSTTANLSSFTGIEGINGNSVWPDPGFNGVTNDFRMYSGALSSPQVQSLYQVGDDPTNAQIAAELPEPATATIGIIGVLAGISRERSRRRSVRW